MRASAAGPLRFRGAPPAHLHKVKSAFRSGRRVLFGNGDRDPEGGAHVRPGLNVQPAAQALDALPEIAEAVAVVFDPPRIEPHPVVLDEKPGFVTAQTEANTAVQGARVTPDIRQGLLDDLDDIAGMIAQALRRLEVDIDGGGRARLLLEVADQLSQSLLHAPPGKDAGAKPIDVVPKVLDDVLDGPDEAGHSLAEDGVPGSIGSGRKAARDVAERLDGVIVKLTGDSLTLLDDDQPLPLAAQLGLADRQRRLSGE